MTGRAIEHHTPPSAALPEQSGVFRRCTTLRPWRAASGESARCVVHVEAFLGASKGGAAIDWFCPACRTRFETP